MLPHEHQLKGPDKLEFYISIRPSMGRFMIYIEDSHAIDFPTTNPVFYNTEGEANGARLMILKNLEKTNTFYLRTWKDGDKTTAIRNNPVSVIAVNSMYDGLLGLKLGE